MTHQVSVADRQKIAKLVAAVQTAEQQIASILAPYFGAKQGKVVHDHAEHEPRSPEVRVAAEKKLIAVVDFGSGYGCYYDPPGICEPCE
jgi:hypothetical protein